MAYLFSLNHWWFSLCLPGWWRRHSVQLPWARANREFIKSSESHVFLPVIFSFINGIWRFILDLVQLCLIFYFSSSVGIFKTIPAG